jgi:tetratricopeptide (TPR) repeat protein
MGGDAMRRIVPVLLLSGALVFCAGGALAAVSVIGSNFAHACYIAARDNSVITEPCDKALEFEPLTGRDLAATYVNRAIVQTNGRHFNAALEDLARAEAVMADLGEIYVSRGNVYYFRHRYEEALKQYDKSIAIGITELFAAHYDRGLALERLDRREEAKAAFRQALELAPDFQLAQERLAAYENGTAIR